MRKFDVNEWHAFWVGFFEAAWPWPAERKISDDYFLNVMDKEHHYYSMGTFFGGLAFLGVVVLFLKVALTIIRGIL